MKSSTPEARVVCRSCFQMQPAIFLFFELLFACWPTLVHSQGGNLTDLMLIAAF